MHIVLHYSLFGDGHVFLNHRDLKVTSRQSNVLAHFSIACKRDDSYEQFLDNGGTSLVLFFGTPKVGHWFENEIVV